MRSDQLGEDRWKAEFSLRQREVSLREKEAKKWVAPLGLAISAATIAAIANVWSTWASNAYQRDLEDRKAESARILSALRSQNPDRAAENLDFILRAGLLTDPALKKNVQNYLKHREQGKGAYIPSWAGGYVPDYDSTFIPSYDSTYKPRH